MNGRKIAFRGTHPFRSETLEIEDGPLDSADHLALLQLLATMPDVVIETWEPRGD